MHRNGRLRAVSLANGQQLRWIESARHVDRSRLASLFYAITALALGVLVALVKTPLAAH